MQIILFPKFLISMKKTLLVSALLGLAVLSGCTWGGTTETVAPATETTTTTAPATETTTTTAQ